jgi:hypothetical protein
MRSAVHSSALESDVEIRETRTSVPPSFQVAAVASLAGLCDSRGNVPLDRCILVRMTDDVPAGLPKPLERVLLHVDGMRSLGEIAMATEMSLTSVIAAYLELLKMDLVDAPEMLSGTFLRTP